MTGRFRVVATVAAVLATVGLVALGMVSVSRGDVPEWLRRKQAFETDYDKYAREQETKCAQEVASLEKQRAEASKDAKGNPVLPELPTANPQSGTSSVIVGVFPDTAPMQVPSAAREGLDFSTIAYAPHDILIAASEKEDKTVGVLFYLRGNADGDCYDEHVYRYPGRGPIVLESLAADNGIVTFRWGDGQAGFFALASGTASFAAYAP
ncbi:MAG TPA: hypothetical protein PLB78_06865 [Anaerolineae bacterium]|nr:hypothetical protein [Anaerolineae bacterium]